MRLTDENTAPWALKQEHNPEDTVADLLLEHAYRCDSCAENFTSRADLDDDWLCEECVEESYDASEAGMRREHGTWSL